ncbi:hypothetical protein ACSCBZ_46810 [Streptomyces niveiscabiei]|uniref:hypothetical protein n=1 Tax=Streptomyces niveiscabiei TaxID=164115 RepID=UPI0006EBB4F6|nr:hypothetical protein [Streptomyces niveiscabiei]
MTDHQPADATGAETVAYPVDTDTIRRSYRAVLWGRAHLLPPAQREVLPALLLGHVQLLADDLDHHLDRMSGEWRATAERVLTGSRLLLAADDASTWDLAVSCRSLLAIYEAHADETPDAGGRP